MARTPIVNPHRRAIRAEQPVGAVAEDVESGGEIQRRRQARREFVQQLTNVAMQLRGLTEVKQLQRGHEGVGRFDDVALDVRLGRWRVETDREQADALRAADQREQQRGAGIQTRGEIGRLTVCVGDESRHAPGERVGDERGLVGTGQPRVGPQDIEGEP